MWATAAMACCLRAASSWLHTWAEPGSGGKREDGLAMTTSPQAPKVISCSLQAVYGGQSVSVGGVDGRWEPDPLGGVARGDGRFATAPGGPTRGGYVHW